MLKPESLKATYGIEISKKLYEEIRINETWDQNGMPSHSEKYDEGYIWSELNGQNNEEPFDKWACNYYMSFKGGIGTLESFFRNHFSLERVRRKGLIFLYPNDNEAVSQQEYWKQDPGISWLYYKNKFDAVFPVLCEMGKARLLLELKGKLSDGRDLEFRYATEDAGALFVGGKHLINVRFHEEKYGTNDKTRPLEVGRPERINGKNAALLYGVHSFSELLAGLELVAEKALFYEEKASGKEKIIYRVSVFGDNIFAKHAEFSESSLIRAGAQKQSAPIVDGRRIGLFYWNYDTSVDNLGGYAEQAFYPDIYRLASDMSETGKNAVNKVEYYMAFDQIEDLEGWYPLDKFIWENDPEPIDEKSLRKIIIDML